ncbi:MAG: thiol:disulfide interchange protein DsbD [Methyloprofundus sp.]|nr:MAG: thiol:disulfide interchange protein DsbD [Methyloprofundus sp.]
MHYLNPFLFLFLLLCKPLAFAINPADILPQEQAFKVTAKATQDGQVQVSWQIAQGYYLYRNKMAFASKTDGISIKHTDLPPGKIKSDKYFGDVAIYRNQIDSLLSLVRPKTAQTLSLLLKHQGCADLGICYPPQSTLLTIELPSQESQSKDIFSSLKQLGSGFKLGLNLFEDQLLPAEQAFQFNASVIDGQTLQVTWQIAEGYYLYREKIQLQLLDTSNTQLLPYNIPRGTPKYDEAFGDVEILHNTLSINIPLARMDITAQGIKLKANFQGCAERGVCYPPMEQTIDLWLPAMTETRLSSTVAQTSKQAVSEQSQIINSLQHDSFALTLLSFFGFGLLLAFTPCVFPMVPILSGIIVGQGKDVSTRKAFLLSLSFVLASAITYTVFGILAALFGSNLQATFQAPWIIYTFSAIFVLLSLAMFGFYNLELPKSIQARLHNASDNSRDGSFLGAAIMGALSSLIVGPCVAAPLAAALMYIGQTGDVILGGSALFVMGMGMGVPLLIIGASAGSLLPKAGHWLNVSKSVFGVLMLAVAVWMLERVAAPEITMLLWATLCIIPAIYLRTLDPLPEVDSGWHKLWKGFGVILLSYGLLILVGLAAGTTNPLQPLKGIALNATGNQATQPLHFKQINSLADLQQELQSAQQQGKPVMLDFYADWCISCKEMEAYTLSNPEVQQQLARFVLLQADVTANNTEHQALLKSFNIFGPPAILFFNNSQQEQEEARVLGYQDAGTFMRHLFNLQ